MKMFAGGRGLVGPESVFGVFIEAWRKERSSADVGRWGRGRLGRGQGGGRAEKWELRECVVGDH
jgi:hypothetical protein